MRARALRSRPAVARLDAAIGAAAALTGAGSVAIAGAPAIVCVAAAALGAALGLYRAAPVTASVIAVVATAIEVPDGSPSVIPAILICANAFAMGRWGGRWSSPIGAAALLTATLAGIWVEHDAGVPAILVIGTAWAAGRAIRAHDVVAARLAERAAELEREREAYAALSVRYERARIASELHDIVAHAISVMVVQAGAGQRLAAVDPALTAETFEAIGEAARRAERDMAQLVTLLGDDDPAGAAPDLRLIEELVSRAAGSGLDVTLRLEGAREGLPAAAVDTAYRVVRESLTNALRYAAGAPVRVVVRGDSDGLLVEVTNGEPPGDAASALAGHGTGNGLRGLRERVDRCGGRLEAGPWGSGGWRVAALLPRRVGAAAAG